MGAQKNYQKVIDITAQKMKLSIKGFFSKCDQIRSFLRIWLHLLKKKLMEKLFCAVYVFFFFLKKKTKLLVKEIVTTFQTNVSAPYSLKISDIFNHI